MLKLCEDCGAKANPGAKFCPACGKPIKQTERPAAAESLRVRPAGESPKKSVFKGAVIFVAGAVLLWAAIGGGYLAYIYLKQANRHPLPPAPMASEPATGAAAEGESETYERGEDGEGGTYDLEMDKGGYFRIKKK